MLRHMIADNQSLIALKKILQDNCIEIDHFVDENNIVSPMPGKIVDLFLVEGDLVNVGEPILSLEAMKMQNEITASCNGVIRKIHVVPGQSVMKDDLLVEITSIDV